MNFETLLPGLALGPICAFLSSVTWAIGTANYSKVSQQYSGFDVNFSRAVIGLPLFLGVALLFSGGFSAFQALELRHWIWFTVAVFASYGLGDVLFFWSSRSLGVPGALAMGSSFPILTALGGVFIDHKPLTGSQYIGFAIAMLGIITVILSTPEKKDTAKVKLGALDHKKNGVILGVLTCFLWAVNAWAVSKGGEGLDTAVGNTVRMTLSIVMSFVLSFAFTRKGARFISREVFRKYGWAFVVEVFGGSFFFYYGLSHSNIVVGTTLASLAPVLAVPLVLVMKLEKFNPIKVGGVVVTILGLYLLVSGGAVS